MFRRRRFGGSEDREGIGRICRAGRQENHIVENSMTKEKLAILGGPRVVQKEFPPYNTIDDAEKREVMEVLDSGVLSAFIANSSQYFYGGPKVQKLERAWEAHF